MPVDPKDTIGPKKTAEEKSIPAETKGKKKKKK
jgi:hypothetical protein